MVPNYDVLVLCTCSELVCVLNMNCCWSGLLPHWLSLLNPNKLVSRATRSIWSKEQFDLDFLIDTFFLVDFKIQYLDIIWICFCLVFWLSFQFEETCFWFCVWWLLWINHGKIRFVVFQLICFFLFDRSKVFIDWN